jgi:hypothetical protein
MTKLLTVACVAFAMLTGTAFAEEKKSLPIQECSTMWKAHKASPGYTDPGKGNRMAAWNEFRKAKCSKTREG